MNPQIWWHLARASGIIAWLFLTASVLWGILLATDLFPKQRRPAWLLDLHRALGGMTVGFVAVHVGALIADSYVHFDLVDVLVPFASAWKPWQVALGVLAFWGLAVVEATSLAIERLPRRVWRAVHLTSYATFVLTSLHGTFAGTDSTNLLYVGTSIATTLALVFAVSYRVVNRRRPRAQQAPPGRRSRRNPDPSRRPRPDRHRWRSTHKSSSTSAESAQARASSVETVCAAWLRATARDIGRISPESGLRELLRTRTVPRRQPSRSDGAIGGTVERTGRERRGSSWSGRTKPAVRRWRRTTVAGTLALALLAGAQHTGSPATEAAGDSSPGIGERSASLSLSMAVQPGEPVPMRIVTEKSKSEYSGKGFTGQGIDVALVDSGVMPVEGLDHPGKIVYGPDLSNEGSIPNLANLDTYGHGTHLAGIIAGDDGDDVVGIAPDSRIVSVKVAGATGETDVAQVIAAIDWVVEHRTDDGLDIRVLNLSLGIPGVGTTEGDALSAAAERAWNAGIVVVAAAGNRGNEVGGIDSPALSPYVIAVGAIESYDSSGAQDWLAPWSSGGNDYRQPDLVAAGRSIMSFRVPGSMLDLLHPYAVVDDRYFLGSGTSQSAAVVSGFAAGLLSRDPSLTPDQVKYMFESRAIDVDKDVETDGAGKLNPKESARKLKDALKAPVQEFDAAIDGTGGIATPSGASWSGGGWNGASWSGGTWSGASWSGASWSGASWSGGMWSGASWSGASWSGASWSGASWSGASWSGASWSGASWSGASWSGAFWSSLLDDGMSLS